MTPARGRTKGAGAASGTPGPANRPADGPGSFAERLRVSRRRVRTPAGRPFTQGDLAAAVGVERNTVSRWENGRILPKDPAVLAKLAAVLHVTTDWLLRGLGRTAATSGAAPGPGREVHEGSRARWQGDTAGDALGGSARALVRSYLERLVAAGCGAEQVRAAEELLVSGARNRVARASLTERSEDDVLADIDAMWDALVQILRRDGIRV